MSTPWQIALVCFVSELGDKSFFLTVILAVWCPFQGARSGKGALLQQIFVALGAASALTVHSVLVLAFSGVSLPVSRGLVTLALAVELVLGLRAFYHLGHAECNRPQFATLVGGEVTAARDEKTLVGNFKAYDPARYGTTEPAAPAQGSTTSNPFESDSEGEVLDSSRWCSCASPYVAGFLTSFFVAFVCIFLAQPGDKMRQDIHTAGAVQDMKADRQTVIDTTNNYYAQVGAVGGGVAAILIAVCVGFLLQRHLSDRRLLLAAALGISSIFLVTASYEIVQIYASYLFSSRQESVNAPVVALQEGMASKPSNAALGLPSAEDTKAVQSALRGATFSSL